MHKTHYRPTRSEQLAIAALIEQELFNETVIVHHVIEDSYQRLHVQIERRQPGGINVRPIFERVIL